MIIQQSVQEFMKVGKDLIEAMKPSRQPSPFDDLARTKRKAENATSIKTVKADIKKMKLARQKAGNKRTTGAKRSAAAKSDKENVRSLTCFATSCSHPILTQAKTFVPRYPSSSENNQKQQQEESGNEKWKTRTRRRQCSSR